MDYNSLSLRGSAPAKTPASDKTVILGNSVREVPPAQAKADAFVDFRGRQGSFYLSKEQMSRGVMLVGSTGCGKTNVFKSTLDRIIPTLTDEDVVFIFDSKGDFMERYYDAGNPRHIVISANSDHKNIARTWNVFGELFDKHGNLGNAADLMAIEISKALFKGMESQSQPFFNIAAADLFAMTLSCFCKDATATRDYSKLNNTELVRFIKKATIADYYKLADKYPGFGYLKSYLGDPSNMTPQALGVFGYLNAMVSSSFVEPFMKQLPSGQFSVRRLIREKGAKVIFLEYDISLGATLEPVYSLFIDLAIKEALTTGKGNSYLICDEFNLVPCCERIQDAVNFGRSKGLKTMIGIQSVNQVYHNYGEDLGKAILAGFVNAFCFRSVDFDTRTFISERFGKTYASYNFAGGNIQREGYTVEDSDIQNLQVGEAFIDLFGCYPFKFRFDYVV